MPRAGDSPVRGNLPSQPATQEVGPTVAPTIADPGPLGLAAFALTTFVLSVFNAGILKQGEPVVLGLALAYGGGAQLLAGMWEFRKGNTFGAVAFSSYGAFWLSFWALVAFYAKDSTPKAIGTYLLAWTIFTAYMTVAAVRTSGAVLAVFVALTLTFLFLALGDLTTTSGLTKVGGWLGLLTAILAWYASFAAVTNATWRRTVLPVFPLSER
jgi:succinate-acetate transporter protein